MIYIPRADAAIGNLSLMYATHLVMTKGEGGHSPGCLQVWTGQDS